MDLKLGIRFVSVMNIGWMIFKMLWVSQSLKRAQAQHAKNSFNSV